MACDDQQFGPVSQRCLQEKDDTLVSSEHIQGKDNLINRKNLERSSDLKCFTRALHAATSRGKGDREAPDKQGTGTKQKLTHSRSPKTAAGPSYTVIQPQ